MKKNPIDALIYSRFGNLYRKVKRDEIIEEGAMHAYCLGELMPVRNPETFGQRPCDFSDKREFFNPFKRKKGVDDETLQD